MSDRPTRTAFAHSAELELIEGGDVRAPGGAVTMALCGAYDHAPPCPLAAHYTGVEQVGDVVSARILFACREDDEARVRQLIGEALRDGVGTDQVGVTTRWRLHREGRAEVVPAERDHADRLIASLGQD